MRANLPARFWKWTTSVVLLHFLVAVLLAASPSAHEDLHHHHEDEAHHAPCGITLLAHGVCGMGAAPVQTPSPQFASFFLLILPAAPTPEVLALEGQSLGRAPPV
ncbi:MAG TPA: hypothetical protein VF585_03515 [Chthoniobacterales bacterium]